MSKIISFDNEARQSLKKGIDTLANAVKTTLGPRGRNVVIDKKFGPPLITKDGVTVANEIILEDPFENMGAQLIKEVASKTSDIAGDGTTTATVLAQAIYREGLKHITSGVNPMDLKNGIDMAISKLVEYLKNISSPIKDSNEISQVGCISANNDKLIGKLIAEAMDKVGKDGIITVEEANGVETFVDVVEGMKFNNGYLSPYFVTNTETMEVELHDTVIILCNKRINSIKEILPLLETLGQTHNGSILILAEDFENEVISTLILNKIKGILRICAVKTPGFGDRRISILEDIAILTDGDVISDDTGILLKDAKVENLGVAKKVIITKDNTTIIDGSGTPEKIEKRTNELKAQIENSKSDIEKEKIQERLANICGGVALLKIGASTEIEMKEKKARVEDALHATRAAVEEGIIPGGGVALLRATSSLHELIKNETNDDIKMGIKIILKAIEEPIRQIVSNAGLEGSVIINNILNEDETNFGFNVFNFKYVNMINEGIVDPTKVTRVALENAASIAGLLLTTDVCIVEKAIEEEKNQISNMANLAGI